MRVLFAASEVYPLAKTGGLADVAGALPGALSAAGIDLRIAMPAYRGWQSRVGEARRMAELRGHAETFTVWQAPHPQHGVPLWLFEAPALFDRRGDPYHDEHGRAWHDNGYRFGAFAQAVALAASGLDGFAADLVHANDWQTGLALAWLRELALPAASVFTIHNLAYQGVDGRDLADALGLPAHWWHLDGVEFHGQLSQMKAGIVHADAITTVSPTYAQEICTPAQGFLLDGLLRARNDRLHGIVNGIDPAEWDPATDPALAYHYRARTVAAGKRANRTALQNRLGLDADTNGLLVSLVTRFAQQKGIDLVLAALPQLMETPLQFAVLGSGDRGMEQAWREAAQRWPGRIGLHCGYDETLAHQLMAGADVLLMPSRFEPCGLTQLYAQRYGTVPVVHRTGGLADTVTDASEQTLADGSATGVQFRHADVGGVHYGLQRALELYRQPALWKAIQRAGMARDFSWAQAAQTYLALYRRLIAEREPREPATVPVTAPVTAPAMAPTTGPVTVPGTVR